MRLNTVIPPDRRLVLDLLSDMPVGLAEIIILFPSEPSKSNGPAILRWLDEYAHPYQGRSAAEIDRDIE